MDVNVFIFLEMFPGASRQSNAHTAVVNFQVHMHVVIEPRPCAMTDDNHLEHGRRCTVVAKELEGETGSHSLMYETRDPGGWSWL